MLVYVELALGPRGAYSRAVEAAQQCIAIVTEIERRHWAMAAHWTLGAIYLDLLWLPEARRIWAARSRYELADGAPERALEVSDALIASALL